MSFGAALFALIVGIAASILGGAVSGLMLGGKDLGRELAAMMGGFYGPLAGATGTLLGLIFLALVG